MNSSTEVVTARYSFELLPHTKGRIKVTIDFTFPEPLRDFWITIPAKDQIVSANGFTSSSGNTASWNGDDRVATLQFYHDVGEVSSQVGGFQFTDEGGWAITQKPSVTWRANTRSHNVEFVEELETQENVAASADGNVVYIGPYSQQQFFGSQQRFRLVLPEAASLVPSHSAVKQSLARASEDLIIGNRRENIVAIAAPTNGVNWGPTGIQSGISGFWCKDDQSVETPHNTWVHEYVHTRQGFDITESTKWLIEGSANYLAALLTYRQCLVSDDEFFQLISTDKDRRAILAEPNQWPSPYTDYKKGMRVLAALDIEIRNATNGQRTIESLFWELNRSSAQITHPKLKSVLVDVTKQIPENWLDRYARSTDVPDIIQRSDIFNRSIPVPVQGTQPICPRCHDQTQKNQCPTCATYLRQQCSLCTSPITGVRDQCPFCGTSLD